jgi:hypothetical protein
MAYWILACIGRRVKQTVLDELVHQIETYEGESGIWDGVFLLFVCIEGKVYLQFASTSRDD